MSNVHKTMESAESPEVSPSQMATVIRALAMDAVQRANSGHPGMPMGMADVATVLFTRFLKFDPTAARWPDRDRFVLSAGHGSMLLYALLYLTGYPDMDLEQLKNFRQWQSRTPGHPEYGHAEGIETTTGPLGQGLGNSVGMALAERMLAARFPSLVDHYTYVIAGDGDLMEGVSQEAISLAGHLRLSKLIVLFDDNSISIDGSTNLATSDDQLMRFRASGWAAERVDGHDTEAVAAAIARAKESDRPSLIACRTVIGYGAPSKQGTSATHGSPLGADEVAAARVRLNWSYPPFEVPQALLDAWRNVGAKGSAARRAWEKRVAELPAAERIEWERRQSGEIPEAAWEAIAALKTKLVAEKPNWATRKASFEALNVLVPAIPDLVGGSADLTGSNLTLVKAQAQIKPGNFAGSYIHYGVREHGMAAAMNGIALHGGFIPYGGSFLVFTDYCRPSIRMAALMGQRVIYVMTHDSIGLGEDGPTHQPIEHLASLRAMPNLCVFRPADAIETAECWQAALQQRHRPSVLALSRQNCPALRTDGGAENLSARGAYVLRPAEGGEARVRLLATGSEVSLAVAARDELQKEGIPTAVVSMPCWELFAEQEPSCREEVMGREVVRVAIEAASPFGWERYVGETGAVIGLTSFGASAPYEELYKNFGLTSAAIVAAAKARLRN